MTRRLGMVIDSKGCINCHSCAVACKVENNLPDGVWWNRVLTDGGTMKDTASGDYPDLHKEFYTLACQHCDNPACVQVCPVGATYRDDENGIIMQDYDRCIGCRMCMAACPYTGVRSFNWDEPHYAIGQDMGAAEAPKHQKHVVEKCRFCDHRVAQGLDPACIEACPARVRTFGDLSDPDSEVSKLVAGREYIQLLPEKGTAPSVYFLV